MKYLLTAVVLMLLLGCGSEGPTRTDFLVEAWAAEGVVGGTMFVGDSITEAWPSEYMPAGSINRGVSGNTTKDVMGRTWLIIQEAPDDLYMMIGINNLHEHMPASDISRDIEWIIESVQSGSPNTSIHIMLLTPSRWIPATTVWSVNDEIVDMLFNHPEIEYTHMFDLFYDYATETNINTVDGTHPSDSGYALMYDALF